jgi:nicotinamide phosphoribosyltransferase
MGRFKQTALTSVDSYKTAHADMLPTGTEQIYSNFTPRSMKHFNVPEEYKADKKIVWVGLQAFMYELKEVWQETFFERHVDAVCNEFSEFVAPFAGPRGFNIERVRALHKLGYLPIRIKSLPEGSRVNVGVPCLTITNTVSEFAWLTNYLETWISCEMWKICTSATTAAVYRKICEKYADLTGGSKEFIQWQCHNFADRGQSGIQDAAKSGVGHLLSFTGTDSLSSVKLINDVYEGKKTFVGGSVPASEHMVQCAGSMEGELETYRRLIKDYPSGVVSIVSDTWNFWDVITKTAATLKEEILARVPDQFGLAKVVFRPDSGDPVDIICGDEIRDISSYLTENSTIEAIGAEAVDFLSGAVFIKTPHGECGDSSPSAIFKCFGKYYKVTANIEWNRYDKQYYYIDGSNLESIEEVQLSPAQKGAVECLAEIFGTTTNDKGFKTLNQRVGLIYGDSITPQRAIAIFERLAAKGYASDNIVFGVGSYTYSYVTRDSLGFAMKATNVVINGESRAIFKDPATDTDKTKKSAKGLLRVDRVGKDFVLRDNVTAEEEAGGELKVVFENGNILSRENFADMRSRLELASQ